VTVTWNSPHLDDLLRHELAHILVGDAYAGQSLPVWAAEGIARYAESRKTLTRAHRRAAKLYDTGRDAPLYVLFRRGYRELPTSRLAFRFYDQAGLVFATLADLVGPARTIEFALDEQEGGQALAQDRLGLQGDELEALVESAAERHLGRPRE
jgi:hypothetical protein